MILSAQNAEVPTQQLSEQMKSNLRQMERVITMQMWLAVIATSRSVCVIILSTRLQNFGTDKEVK